jgi:hypothetical protein
MILAPALAILHALNTASPIVHLRADTGLVLDGKGAVSMWTDLSARKTHFVGGDSARRPVPAAKGINGLATVRFGGSHLLQDTTSLPLDSGFTLFVVAQDSNPAGWTALVNKGEGDLSVNLWGADAGNFNLAHSWVTGGGIAESKFETIEPMLYVATWSGSKGRIFVAGRLEDTGTYAVKITRNKSTALGAGYGTGKWQGFLKGHLGEVLIYPGELSDSMRLAIEDSLLKRWKIARLGTWRREPIAVKDPRPIVHLRADTGLVLDGKGAVSMWTDLSARKTHFVGGDSARRPVPAAKGINGLATVRFGGSHLLQDTTSLPLDSGFTLFVVAQDSNPAGWTALVNKGEGDLSVNLWGADAGNFNLAHSWVTGGGIAESKFETIEPMLYVATWSGSKGRIFVAGRLEDTGTYAVKITRNKSTALGAGYGTGKWQGFLKGHLGEVLIYPGELSDSMRLAIEDSLLKRWKIARLGTWKHGDKITVVVRARVGMDLERVDGIWRVRDGRAVRLELRSPSGRLLASTSFVGGVARMGTRPGMNILSIVDPDGGTRTRLLPDIR